MEINIPKGTRGVERKIILSEDTASQYESGLLEVFATPAMVAFMEQTAYRSIETHLPKGYSSVGISINVQHKKATLPGKEIICKSEVVVSEGKKIIFSVKAYEGDVEIGAAEHARYIINIDEFMKRLKD